MVYGLLFILLVSLLFIFCGIFIYEKYISRSLRINTHNSEILELLKSSETSWCLVPLGFAFDKPNKKLILFSHGFFAKIKTLTALEGGNINFAQNDISWNDITWALGQDAVSPFQKGLQHIINYRGDFTFEIVKGSQKFIINGLLTKPTNKTKNHSKETVKIFPLESLSNKKPGINNFSENVDEFYIFLTLEDDTKSLNLQNQISEVYSENSKLQETLNTIPLPIWTRDNFGMINSCNKAYWKILGTQQSQVISRQCEFTDYKNPKVAKNIYKRAITSKTPESDVISMFRKDSKVYFNVTETPVEERKQFYGEIKNAPQADLYINKNTVGIAVDISQYKHVQEQYEESNKICNFVLNELDIPFIVFSDKGTVIFYNDNYIKLFDIEKEFLEQKPSYSDLLDNLREKRKLPEYIDFATIKNTFSSWIKDSEHLASCMWHLQNGVVLNLIPTKNKFGDTLLKINDISESLALESRYKSLSSVYTEVMNISHDAIIIIGIDHRIKYFNQSVCQLLKVDEISFLGIHVKEFLDKFSNKSWKESIITCIELRNKKAEYVALNNKIQLISEYIPLPDGTHMLCFSETRKENKNACKTILFQEQCA